MSLRSYFGKMRGTTHGGPPRVSNAEIFWSWAGAFLAMTTLSWIDRAFMQGLDLTLMLGSFGASSVLLYGAVRSPLAQPRNVFGGQVFSAAIGVASWKLLHQAPWLADAMAVSTAIAVMHATRTLHPPGGATALIACIGSPQLHDLGFVYVLVPTALGSVILLAVAVVFNNVPRSRRYPEIWF